MQPLRGKRVLITRPRRQADSLALRLVKLGAEPVFFPAIEIAPVEDPTYIDQALQDLAGVDWVIFTSANGVEAVWQRLAALGLDAGVFSRTRLAAVGPVTAGALEERHVRVDFVPEKYAAEAIAAGIGPVQGLNVVLFSAEIARETLPAELQQCGAQVRHVPVYRTLPAQPDERTLAELNRGVDIITLASPSAAQSFVQTAANHHWPWLERAIVACIGPVTAQAARECGLSVHLVAAEATSGGLAEALAEHFSHAKEKP